MEIVSIPWEILKNKKSQCCKENIYKVPEYNPTRIIVLYCSKCNKLIKNK